MILANILISILLTANAEGDTLTMRDAERMLAERNAEVQLSAANLAEAEADARQSRRWENPEVSGLYNVYNPLNSRWFDAGNDGELDIAVSQPLPIGRRHRAAAADARLHAASAQAQWTQFAALMLMKRQMCEVWAAEARMRLMERELQCVDRVLAAYGRAPQAVAAIEVRRMETLRLGLLAERTVRLRTVAEAKADLAATIGLTTADFCVADPKLHEAAELVPQEHPGLQAHQSLVEAAEADQRLQRTLAWPQVSLTAEYDKNGNIGHNFWAVGANVTLPLFDRNQEGIRLAKIERERRAIEHRQMELEIQHSRNLAAGQMEEALRLKDEAESLTAWSIEAIEKQYLAHNISLLEFVDLLTSYREAQEMAVEANLRLFTAAIDHNISLGTEIHVIQ